MNNGNPIISIIIPCYNAVNFIDRSFGSIMQQTANKALYEVIAVDDASTDDTLIKLKEWEKKYPNQITVITYQENLRQGGARNVGIRHSKGEYIGFLDVDDWIEPDALELYLNVIRENSYDIISGKFEENNEFEYRVKNEHRNDEVIRRYINGKDNISQIVKTSLGYIWNSIYKRELIVDNDLWFPEKLFYEDIYWAGAIKLYANDIYMMDVVTNHHFYNTESTINKKNVKYHIDRLDAFELLLEKYKQENIIDVAYREILDETIEVYVINSFYMFFTRMDEIPDVYSRIRRNLYFYLPNWEKDYDISKLPMVFEYLLKYISKAENASPEDLIVFREALEESLI